MNIKQEIKRLVLATALLIPGLVNAAVILPGLDIVTITGDTGVTVTVDSFNIDATAYQIVFDDNNLNIDIADEIFTLSSTSGTYDPTAIDGTWGLGFFDGSFTVGTAGSELLIGSFTSMEVNGWGNNEFDFFGDVLFTSGSLMGATNGQFEGSTFLSIQSGELELQSKLGEVAVVPVPASVWLFGSGLLGLVGVARRKEH